MKNSFTFLDCSNPSNRLIRASKDIPQIKNFMSLTPLITIVDQKYSAKLCCKCFSQVNSSVKCSECNFTTYCSSKCFKKDCKAEHKVECKMLRKFDDFFACYSPQNYLSEQVSKKTIENCRKDLYLGVKMLVMCFTKKNSRAQSCLDKMYFTFKLPSFETRLKFFCLGLALLRMVSSISKIDEDRIESYVSKCDRILKKRSGEVNDFFDESLEHYTEIKNTKSSGAVFFRHDYGLFDDTNTNLRAALGKI